MKAQSSIKLVFICALAALAGCSGTVQVQSQNDAGRVQQRQSTVYIVPNCQVLGGETYCQWIEPRGATPAKPARSSETPTSGIAI